MILDIAILALISFFTFKSYKAGMANELMTATGWILSILIALKLTTPVKNLLNAQIPDLSSANGILGFIGALLLVRLLFIMAAKTLAQGPEGKAKFADKFISTIFGFLKGLFFTSLILTIITQASLFSTLQIDPEESITYKPVHNFLNLVYKSLQNNIPEFDSMSKNIEQGAEEISEMGEQAVDEIDDMRKEAEELIEKGDKVYTKGKEMNKNISEDWDELEEITR